MSNKVLLNVKVIPNSRSVKIFPVVNDELKIKLTAQPEKGLANVQLISLIADHFKLKKNDIKIVKGHLSKNKVLSLIISNPEEFNNIFRQAL